MPDPAKERTVKAAGVVLVFIDERGHAIAHAADFEPSAPGGFTLSEGAGTEVASSAPACKRCDGAEVDTYVDPTAPTGFRERPCPACQPAASSAGAASATPIRVGQSADEAMAKALEYGRCEECDHVFSREEMADERRDPEWGHRCFGQWKYPAAMAGAKRCESYRPPYPIGAAPHHRSRRNEV